jgi:Tol biopolymer transport system component
MTGSDVLTITRTEGIVGTPAYMAPEQLAGHDATARTDLFALGLVLYEMAAGRPPVPGASLGNILMKGGTATAITPPSKVRDDVPPKFDALVARLLAADPQQRPDSAATVASDLRAIAASAKPASRTARVATLAAAVVVVAAVAAAMWWQRRSPSDAPLQVGEVTTMSVSPGLKSDVAYSPDGSSLVFSWRGDNGNAPALYVMHGQGKPRPLASTTANDVSPAWSPDGRRLAFLRVNPGLANELMVVTVSDAERGDGAATRIRELRQPEWLTRSARPVLAWTPDGRAIAVPLSDPDTGLASLFRVGLDGSAPRRLVASRAGQGITTPAFSRDGRWLVFSDSSPEGRELYMAEVAADGSIGPHQPVPGSGRGSSPSLSPDGRRLVWMSQNQILEWSRAAAARLARRTG